MHPSATIRLLPPCLLALFLSGTTFALPKDAVQQRRIDEYLAQKPMHTTALLAGAAATEVAIPATPAIPAMPTTALRSRVLNQRSSENDAGPIVVSLPDGSQEVLMDRDRIKELVEEYVHVPYRLL